MRRVNLWSASIAAVLLLTAIAAVALSRGNSLRQDGQFVVDNKTSGFVVDQVQRDGELLRLALINRYHKNIKAYTVAIGNVKMEEDFIYSDRVIAPQEVFILELPRSRSSRPADSLRISVLAVVFEDGTGDGLMANVVAIKDRRLGERLQFKRTVQILQALIDSTDEDASKLVQLNTRAASLPEEESFSRAFKSGLHGGKERLLQIVKRLEQPQDSEPGNFKEKLLQLKQEFETKISKVID